MEILLAIIMLLSVALVVWKSRVNGKFFFAYTIFWGISMLATYYLTIYWNENFSFIGIIHIVFIGIIALVSDFRNKPSNFKKLAILTILLLIFSSIAFNIAACYHEVVVEVPVFVSKGNVTVDTNNIPKELHSKVKQEVMEFSKMPDGIYSKEFRIKYQCLHQPKAHEKVNCTCTEEALCDACKDFVEVAAH